MLRASGISHLDRAAIEHLFQIQRRTALLLMKEVGPEMRTGGSVVRRRDLLKWVEDVDRTEGQELRRRENVVDQLNQGVAEYKAARRALDNQGKEPMGFTLPRALLATTVASLPPNIQIESGRISVSFDPEEPNQALQLLYVLGLALANDYDGFLLTQQSDAPDCESVRHTAIQLYDRV